jgi:hypothetical protein
VRTPVSAWSAELGEPKACGVHQMGVKAASGVVVALALLLSGCSSNGVRGPAEGVTAGSSLAVTVSSGVPSVAAAAPPSSPVARSIVTSSPTPPATVAPTPSSVAEATPTLVSPSVLGQDSSGAVVELKVGQTVLFEPGQDWVPLMIDGSVLRVVTQSGGYPSDQPLKATILAVSPGTASIDDHTDAACFHVSPPCLRPDGSLHFSVVVTG